jgi:hypothetical protein
LQLHPRVDPSDGSCTRVPDEGDGGDGGPDGDVHHVVVEQDLDQVQKGLRPTLPSKASPGSLTPFFKIMQLCLL